MDRDLDNILKAKVRDYLAGSAIRYFEFDDLLQIARIAAWMSERNYRPDRGGSPRTYAVNMAVYAMRQLSRYSQRIKRNSARTLHYDAWDEGSRDQALRKRDFAPMLIDAIAAQQEPTARPKVGPKLHDPLTPAQLQTLRLTCTGLIAQEVAQRLGISKRTVVFHLDYAYRKLGVRSSIEAYNVAMQTGLIEPPKRLAEK